MAQVSLLAQAQHQPQEQQVLLLERLEQQAQPFLPQAQPLPAQASAVQRLRECCVLSAGQSVRADVSAQQVW